MSKHGAAGPQGSSKTSHKASSKASSAAFRAQAAAFATSNLPSKQSNTFFGTAVGGTASRKRVAAVSGFPPEDDVQSTHGDATGAASSALVGGAPQFTSIDDVFATASAPGGGMLSAPPQIRSGAAAGAAGGAESLLLEGSGTPLAGAAPPQLPSGDGPTTASSAVAPAVSGQVNAYYSKKGPAVQKKSRH
jgi:hypothetical protein